jgi:hypothetical protein
MAALLFSSVGGSTSFHLCSAGDGDASGKAVAKLISENNRLRAENAMVWRMYREIAATQQMCR